MPDSLCFIAVPKQSVLSCTVFGVNDSNLVRGTGGECAGRQCAGVVGTEQVLACFIQLNVACYTVCAHYSTHKCQRFIIQPHDICLAHPRPACPLGDALARQPHAVAQPHPVPVRQPHPCAAAAALGVP